jgi:uncharacterized protein YehS (DUF1456 family)
VYGRARVTHNDLLRRLRWALDLSDAALRETFAAGGAAVEPAQLANLLRADDDPAQRPLSDDLFGAFLDGLVALRRGRRDGEPPRAPAPMNNNRVLRALRIALQLTDKEMIEVMGLADIRVSRGELSALFRAEGHDNYRVCGDQFVRNFVKGLGLRHRRG